MKDDPQMLNPKEVAEILGVHQKTVHLWLRTGKIEGTKISYRAWRIPRSALASFIESNSNARSVHESKDKEGKDKTTNSIDDAKSQKNIHEFGTSPHTKMKQYIKEIMSEETNKGH
jgi:excisionase family DNA binding protein